MSVFELVGEILKVFFDLIPRFMARPTCNYILVVDRFLFGPMTIRWRPVLYVPVLDYLEYWPLTEQSVNSEMQSLETACGESITVDVGFSYKIADHLLLRQELGDEYVTRLSMIVRGSVREVVNGHTFSHLCESGWGTRLHDCLEEEIAEQFASYGVDLTYLTFEDLARSANVRHFGMNLAAPAEG